MRTKAQIEAAKRDGKFCLWCIHSENPALVPASEVHHLARRQPGSDKPQLCVHLCQKCHSAHHNGRYPNTSQLLDLMYKVYHWKLREVFPKFFGKH